MDADANDDTIRAYLCKPPKELSPQGLSFKEPSGGRTVEVSLPYSLATIDIRSVPLINRYLPYVLQFGISKQQRCYTIYVPSALHGVNMGTKVPLVCLFHGTDETAWDGELYAQEKAKEKSWQELAEQKKFIIVWGQSQGVIRKYERSPSEFYMYWWQPGPQDSIYISEMLSHIDVHLKQTKSPVRVDESRRYAVGFSNGGMFMSDVIIDHCNKFAAICNYMGGLCFDQQESLRKKNLENVRKVPLLIITAPGDENCNPCLLAQEYFEKELHYDVQFELLQDKTHEYYAESTPYIYEFFEKHKFA